MASGQVCWAALSWLPGWRLCLCTPEWPDGTQQQQVHLDLHVDDLQAAHEKAISLGARVLKPASRPADNPDGDEVFAVYADPAGRPFCLGVHNEATLATFLEQLGRDG